MVLSGQEFSTPDFKSTSTSFIRLSSDCSTNSGVVSCDYELINYCPEVFRSLQEFGNVDADDYMLSVYGNENLRKITSPWKSGSALHVSHDNKFIIKTIRKSEMKVFLDMLPNYYNHVRKHRSTLLSKIYGLHVVKPQEGPKVRFVVIGNILYSDLTIHKRFNLKGSSQGRGVNKSVGDENILYKDIDLDLAFHLDSPLRNRLIEQIQVDCDFLEKEGVMDYSLLMGVHSLRSAASESLSRGSSVDYKSRRSDSHSSTQSNPDQDLTLASDVKSPSTGECEDKLGVRMRACAFRMQKIESGGVMLFRTIGKGDPEDVILYFGIVDILQGYNMVKKVEHVFKSFQYDPQSISAVNPNFYSIRFQDFLSKVFPDK